MAKFLKDSELNAALEHLISNAEEYIMLVSPYIKLHEKTKALLERRRKEGLLLIVIFGKSDDGKNTTLSKEDFEFFKTFTTVDVRHEQRLHAKFYSSEKEAILSSMNLYDYSQNNNYEFGIHLKSSALGGFSKEAFGFGDTKLDQDAQDFFWNIYDGATKVYVKEPVTKMEGIIGFRKEVLIDTKVVVDESERFFGNHKTGSFYPKPAFVPKAAPQPKSPQGYCIRTGTQIPFNAKRPFCDTAFESWSKFKNPDFAEKFCHFSGESSSGETTFSKPILKKNWSKAKEVHGF
jgi:ribosomal protein L25 (general stress protein Ctc)